MTEKDWLQCEEPSELVSFLDLRGGNSTRKRRLFMAATNRRLWVSLSGVEREVVECWERYVDGLISRAELDASYRRATGGYSGAPDPENHDYAWADALSVADHAGDQEAELSAQTDLLREVFGNPFRPIRPDARWLTPTVRQLAQAAYDERSLPGGVLDPVRFTILADALEDAGCADADLLNHLRGPGPHVRGCEVLDLLLDKK